MTIQPAHHWTFAIKDQTVDKITGAKAQFKHIKFGSHGQIGFAVQTTRRDSQIKLGKKVGQFGKGDFTIAFGMQLRESTKNIHSINIISNRNTAGHGNWFSLRQQKGNQLTFEVDENSKGKNYTATKSKSVIVQNKWCHIAIVRRGPKLQIFHDGVVVAANTENNRAIANITSNVETILGISNKSESGIIAFEDLRIYHHALTQVDIQSLIPAKNRFLKTGEVELLAADGARFITRKNIKNIQQLSQEFESFRLGADTGATLYADKSFEGTAQKIYSDITEVKRSRLKGFPQSIHVWRNHGEVFQGSWAIRGLNGKFLQWDKTALTTSSSCLHNVLFNIRFNENYGQLQLIPATKDHGLLFHINLQHSPLIVDDTESGTGAFSIRHVKEALWLHQTPKNTFVWVSDREKRTTFFRVAKFAEHESDVGELKTGEVALYQHAMYHGYVWTLSDNSKDIAGNYLDLSQFKGLDNTVSSIRLGPDTGVTLFANNNQKVDKDKRENQIEDIVTNQPSLTESQIGGDNISALKIFKRVSASNLFTQVTSKLSQDYRMKNKNLEEFSAYRTTLKLNPDVKSIEVSATDLTKIEVDDVTYVIDEVRSVILKPNALNQIMITSQADGIDTPSLKFRTANMANNERVIVSPAEQLHNDIANLDDNALWNAKDAKGKPIVDHKAHSKADVASVQNTVRRAFASTKKAPGTTALVEKTAGTEPWAINFSSQTSNNALLRSVTSFSKSATAPNSKTPNSKAKNVKTPNVKTASTSINETTLKQSDFETLLLHAPLSTTLPTVNVNNGVSGINNLNGKFISNPFGGIVNVVNSIGDAVKGATSAVVGFANDVMNVVVEVGGEVVRFIVDTVEKVAEFAQAVIEKVVKSIKQFIEFLRFLFNWDDILKTQRFIKSSINSAFDSAADIVVSAKKPIADAIGSLQEGISDSIDNVIKSIGVDPSEVASDEGGLPEAAEWFLNKIFGSVGPGKKSVLSLEKNSDLDASDTSLVGLAEKLTRLVVMAGTTMTEGLIDTIENFVKNPTRPELALATVLQLVKELSLIALDAAEELIMAMLDAVVSAIEIMRSLLNAEIRIPFISSLFELIGAGNLSIINLISVLVAIPTTVMSKIMFGERPFKDVDVPVLTDSNNRQNLALRTDSQPQSTPPLPAARDRQKDKQLVQSYGVLNLNASVISGLISAVLDSTHEDVDLEGSGTVYMEVFTLGLDWLAWLGSFPASPNNPGGFPYDVLGHDVNIKDNPIEYWQRIVWGYRTLVLALDTCFMIGNAVSKLPIPNNVDTANLTNLNKGLSGGKPFIVQRMRRGSEFSLGIHMGLSAVDLVLTSIYLFEIPEHEKPGLEIANEMIAILPQIVTPLRIVKASPDVQFYSAASLGIINGVKTMANYAIGTVLLSNTLQDI